MPYVCCKCCGNSDINRVEFIAGDKMICCKICNCYTALDPSFVNNESSYYVRMIKGYQMLKNGGPASPLTIFERLKREDPSDYRFWLGSVLALTNGLSGQYDPALLEPVMQAARGNPNGEYIVSRAVEIYSRSQENAAQVREAEWNVTAAERNLQEKEDELKAYKESSAAMDPGVIEADRKVDAEERRLKANKRKTAIFGLLFVLFAALTSVTFNLSSSAQSAESSEAAFLVSILAFGAFLLCLAGAITFPVLALVQIFKRGGIRNSINQRAAEAYRMKNAWKDREAIIKDEIKQANDELYKCRQELYAYRGNFFDTAEFSDWCRRMEFYLR